MRIFNHYIQKASVFLFCIEIITFISVLFFLLSIINYDIFIHRNGIVFYAIFVTLITITSLSAVGGYKRIVWTSTKDIFYRILTGSALGVSATIIFTIIVFPEIVSADLILEIALVIFVLFGISILGRLFVKSMVAFRERIRPRALVLGGGRKAEELWSRLGNRAGVQLIAFCTEASSPLCPDTANLPQERIRPLPQDIASWAHQKGVNDIVVALDERREALPIASLLECRLGGLRVLDSAAFLERHMGRVAVDGESASRLIFSDGFERQPVGMGIKRLFDIVAAASLLLFLAPLMAVVACVVRLDSAGPVFYRQERVGWQGRIFSMIKFRSMTEEAETPGTPMWAGRDDPRITFVGRWLRRMRIDELPQLVNVLKGDMSLIGPRPERPYFVDQLSKQIPLYVERHRVRPGITGWAQTNHTYTDSVEETKIKLEYDLYYLKNWSLFLDFVIAIQTIRIILFGEGAR